MRFFGSELLLQIYLPDCAKAEHPQKEIFIFLLPFSGKSTILFLVYTSDRKGIDLSMNSMKQWSLPFFWLLTLLYLELLVHAGMFEQFSSSARFSLGFAAAIAMVLALFSSLLPQKAVLPANLLLLTVITLLYGSQLVYSFIFGTPYSVAQMGLGTDAITQFWRELLSTMGDRAIWIAGLLLPFLPLVLLFRFCAVQKPHPALLAAISVVLAVLTFADVRRGGTAMFSDYYFFSSTRSTTAQTMERFGVPMTFCLELTRPEPSETGSEQDALSLPVIENVLPETQPQEALPEEETLPPYNILDVDFDALNQATDNEKLLKLNNYFSQLTGTRQNEYTGKFRDYNLILICAESFSPAAVDPVITPTLYKMTHEGFLFRNYYNSFPNTTTDGEYTLTQGLYPDSSRDKFNASMVHSVENALPFTLGNAFYQQRGIRSYGYHNNVGNYYHREETHPNMGYSMKFAKAGMTFSNAWPASDLEMMEQSVDDFIHDEQFHAYYMTFSGHYKYYPSCNNIAKQNFDQVKDLPYPDVEQKAYLACNIELDKAMSYLLSRLEEEGIADKTVIVMAADHAPYGLSKKQFFQMMDWEPDFFSWYKSDLVFWVGGMEEPVTVDTYCCNADILPTLLNLWGLSYDSRMLAGTDVFSDGAHMAVLVDHSFLTDQVWFNTNTCEVRYLVDQDQIPADYLENMNRLIASRFDVSTEILRQNYYAFAFPETQVQQSEETNATESGAQPAVTEDSGS